VSPLRSNERRVSVRRSAWLVTALAAILAAGPLVDAAFAKKQKAGFSAVVAGKRLRSAKRAIVGLYTTTSFSVNVQTRVRRGVSRALSINCLGTDLKIITPPAPIPQCFGFYTETRVRRGGGLKQWTSAGMEPTGTSFDGTKLEGTFRGVIGPSTSNPTEPPVTVEGGSFTVFVRDLGV